MKLLVFSQPNCAPCFQVSKYLDERDISYKKINVWDEPERAAQYGIMGTPVIILFDEDDSEIRRTVGFRPTELTEIVNLIKGE